MSSLTDQARLALEFLNLSWSSLVSGWWQRHPLPQDQCQAHWAGQEWWSGHWGRRVTWEESGMLRMICWRRSGMATLERAGTWAGWEPPTHSCLWCPGNWCPAYLMTRSVLSARTCADRPLVETLWSWPEAAREQSLTSFWPQIWTILLKFNMLLIVVLPLFGSSSGWWWFEMIFSVHSVEVRILRSRAEHTGWVSWHWWHCQWSRGWHRLVVRLYQLSLSQLNGLSQLHDSAQLTVDGLVQSSLLRSVLYPQIIQL